MGMGVADHSQAPTEIELSDQIGLASRKGLRDLHRTRRYPERWTAVRIGERAVH